VRYLELQLVDPPHSRTTAYLLHDGQLYVPADLGFLSRRMPNGAMRFVGGIISSVKHWHEDAARDGRVVLRAAGKRYERQAVRVTDPEICSALRAQMEAGVPKAFGAPLLDEPADPDAIWFFRMDPRAAE
jgi:hypothetical protein